MERDIAMGENLIWLVEKYYPGHKIMVWAASMHNLRNPKKISLPSAEPGKYKDLITMGEIAGKHFGDKIYSIMFIAYEGKIGYPHRNNELEEVKKAKAGTIEDFCHQTGKPYLFIDFKTDAKDPSTWLRKTLPSRPLGHEEYEAIWPDQFDAMIYFEKVTPSTKLETESNQ